MSSMSSSPIVSVGVALLAALLTMFGWFGVGAGLLSLVVMIGLITMIKKGEKKQ